MGENVTLRPLTLSDTEDILRWRSEANVRANLLSARPPTREEHIQWFEAARLRRDREDFVIVHMTSGRTVGTVSLVGTQSTERAAEFGILIGEPDFRGKGLARESSQLVLRYGFSVLGLESIFLNLYADNLKAKRLYETLGFTTEAQADASSETNVPDRRKDSMRLTRSRWIANCSDHTLLRR